jgi:hypothetical protein
MGDKEATEKAKKEAKKAEAKAKKEAKQAAKEENKGAGTELDKGTVTLTIVSPFDSGQLRKLEEHLYQVQGLSLVLIGGSVDGGTEVVVSAENYLPLLDILREMPPVAQVVRKGKTTQITLKAAQPPPDELP